MQRSLNWLLKAAGVAVALSFATPAFAQDRAALKAELKEKLEAIDSKDAPGLFDLAIWAETQGLKTDMKRIMRRVIRADPDHAEARKALNYEKYKGEWMTARQIESAKKKELEAEMEAKGLKRWGEEWVPVADWEKLNSGLVKADQNGETIWVTPKQKERIELGMELQADGSWLTAEEVEKRAQGLWKIEKDGKADWVTQEQADEFHAQPDSPWEFEQDFVALRTTCRYEFAQEALRQANATVRHVYNLLSIDQPAIADFRKIDLVLVSNVEQYNQIGQAIQDAQDAAMSTAYGAFSFVDPESNRAVAVANYTVPVGGAGDVSAADQLSAMMVRHAIAEAVIRNLNWTTPPPRWFLLCVGSYLGRYWHPFYSNAIAGLGPWSLDYLQRLGGLVENKKYFEGFEVTVSTILQSGLMYAYVLHGEGAERDKMVGAWAAMADMIKADDQSGIEKKFSEIEKLFQTDEKAFLNYVDSMRS